MLKQIKRLCSQAIVVALFLSVIAPAIAQEPGVTVDTAALGTEYQAVNPFLPPYEFIPDGEPRVFGDRLYHYGSHDEGTGTFCLGDYVLWSAPVDDLSDWRYEGVYYKRSEHPGIGSNYLYAPDVVQRPDNKYYLYYGLSNMNAAYVAVSSPKLVSGDNVLQVITRTINNSFAGYRYFNFDNGETRQMEIEFRPDQTGTVTAYLAGGDNGSLFLTDSHDTWPQPKGSTATAPPPTDPNHDAFKIHPDSKVIATFDITADMIGSWTILTQDIDNISGTHAVFFVFNTSSGASGSLGDLSYFTFYSASPVTALTAIAQNRQIVLSWAPPTSAGAGGIVGYQVQIDGSGSWMDVDGLTYTFNGLTNGVLYSFNVRAVRKNGSGAIASVDATPYLPTAVRRYYAGGTRGLIPVFQNLKRC